MAYELSFGERLKVGWLLLWRGFLLFSVLVGLAGLLVRFILVFPGALGDQVYGAILRYWLILCTVFIVPFALPIVVKMMLNKQFSTFRLQVVSTQEQTPQSVTGDVSS